MRRLITCALLLACVASGCGSTRLFSRTASATQTVTVTTPIFVGTSGSSARTKSGGANTAGRLGFPYLATKNTTRVAGSDPVADAAAVALAVFPSAAPGTHPTAVTLAPTDDWQAALASASLMGQPFRAPILLSGAGSLPSATSQALGMLAPTGDGALGGVQLVRVGDVPSPPGMRTADIAGSSPYALAAGIDRYEAAHRHKYSINVIVASAADPQYAMPAAGLAAESGEPILYVSSGGVPAATAAELRRHGRPNIYVVGPTSVVSASVMKALKAFGPVYRVAGATPAANSVALAEYRNPPCTYGQGCVHVAGSFGWAITSPGHAYVLINESRTLDAAAAAALSSSGGYGPQLLVQNAAALPASVLNYFVNYATPGYTSDGPTAAVYNHGWFIGGLDEISASVQAQVDSLLEVVPQK